MPHQGTPEEIAQRLKDFIARHSSYIDIKDNMTLDEVTWYISAFDERLNHEWGLTLTANYGDVPVILFQGPQGNREIVLDWAIGKNLSEVLERLLGPVSNFANE
jgi:hypothetical protein